MNITDILKRVTTNPFGSGAMGSEMAKHTLAGGFTVDTATGEWSEGGPDARHADRSKLIQSSPIQAAVRLVATSIADLVTNTLYIVDENDNRVEPNTVQKQILNLFRYHPNPLEDGYEFIANVVTDMLMEGNGLIGIDRMGQRVDALYRMIPKDAKVGTNRYGDDFYSGPVWLVHNSGMVFNRNNMVHARIINFDGYNSSDDRKGFVKGPVQTLQRTMLINGYLDEHIEKYFTSDANGIRMFVKATDAIGKEDIKETRGYVAEIAKKNRGIAFLTHALEPVSLSTTAIDQSMAALRTFQIREASRIFGVPVPMLGEEKSGTNIAALKQDFWQNCIKPHANTLLAAMSMKLLNQRHASKGFRFAVDPTEMIKGDPDTMAKLLQALGDAQRPGPLSPTEWRKAGGWETEMPEETDTDRRVYADLARRQAGLPSSVRTPGAGGDDDAPEGDDGGQINTDSDKDGDDDNQGKDKDKADA